MQGVQITRSQMKSGAGMSNKMLRNFFISLFVWTTIQVFCFEPSKDSFANIYQFKLYKNWLKKGDFQTQFPSKLSPEKIIKTFKDKVGNDVVVEYTREEGTITEQREKLPETSLSRNDEFRQYLDYLENFIYRLNNTEEYFFTDYAAEVDLEYSHFSNMEAIEQLWTDFENDRIRIVSVGVVLKIDKTGIKLTSESNKEITFFFTGTEELQAFLKKNKKEEDKKKIVVEKKPKKEAVSKVVEEPAGDIAYVDVTDSNSEIFKKPSQIYDPVVEQNLPDSDQLSLTEYIRFYHKVRQSKQLLNNQIHDTSEFLRKEFPYHQRVSNGQHHTLQKPSFNGFNSKISFNILHSDESVSFIPIQDFEVRNKKFYFEDEIINLSNLNETEIENLTPFLSQIIYEHRVIGTKLLNFFLVHDAVETTLVVKGETREIYDIYSYANLLLMLNKYWEDRIVYFNLQDVKKVNGYIEFKGMLIADSPESKTFDMAEIRFHLDNEYKIDLAMMFLNPEVLKE